MTRLADFLLLRIGEDEAAALLAVQTAAAGDITSWYWSNAGEAIFLDGTSIAVVWGDEPSRSAGRHMARWDPARVLTECDAKRRLLGYADTLTDEGNREVLRLLALPYANHPDFCDDWLS